MTITIITTSGKVYKISDKNIKAYSNYIETCLTGLALPDAQLTFTAKIENYQEIPPGSVCIVSQGSNYATSKMEAFRRVASVERVGKDTYDFICTGWISSMTENYDGDYYEWRTGVDAITVETVFDEITADVIPRVQDRNLCEFRILDNELKNTVMTGRISPCAKREALQSLMYMTNSALVESYTDEDVPVKLTMVPISSLDAEAPKFIPATDILTGTTIENPTKYAGVNMTVVDYHSPTTYDLDSSKAPIQYVTDERGTQTAQLMTGGSGNGLEDHILYWKSAARGPTNGKFYVDDLFYHTLWFYNIDSSANLIVKSYKSGEGVKDHVVVGGDTQHIRRVNANYIEMSCDEGLYVNVYGFKMNRAETPIVRVKPGTDAAQDKDMLNVSGGEVLNSGNYSKIFEFLYDYFVENPRWKCRMKFVADGFNVGDKVVFPLEYGGAALGIISSMDFSIGSKRIAEAVITCKN